MVHKVLGKPFFNILLNLLEMDDKSTEHYLSDMETVWSMLDFRRLIYRYLIKNCTSYKMI